MKLHVMIHECLESMSVHVCCLIQESNFFQLHLSIMVHFCIYICKKLHFNEMMMVISWIFKLLARWNNSLQIHMSLYSDTSSWFQAIQSCYLNHYFNYTSSIHIGGIIVSLLALSAIDCGFDFWLGQTKNYKTSIYCFLDN